MMHRSFVMPPSLSPSQVRHIRGPSGGMEPIADGGWVAGAAVRIIGLAKTPQHNGKVGVISAKAGPEGRVAVELGKGKPMAVRRENLELVKVPQANGQAIETGAAKPAVEAGANATDEAARRESIVAQVAAARVQAAAEAAGGANATLKPGGTKEQAGRAKKKAPQASDQAIEAEAAAKVAVEAEAAATAKLEAVAKLEVAAKPKAVANVEAGAKAINEAARREEIAAKVAAAQAAAETAGGAKAVETAEGAQDSPEYVVYAQYNEKMNPGGSAKEKAGGGAKAKEKTRAKAAAPAAQGKAEAAAKAVARVEAGAKAIKEKARREDYLGKTTLVGLPPPAPTKVAAAPSREASVQPIEPTVAATPAPTSPTSPGAAGAQDFERAAAARARVVAARAAAVAESSPRRGSGGAGGPYAWPQLSSSGPSWATILLGAAAQFGGTAAPAPAPSVPRQDEPTWREMLLNPSPSEPSSPTIADKLMVEEAHVRAARRKELAYNS